MGELRGGVAPLFSGFLSLLPGRVPDSSLHDGSARAFRSHKPHPIKGVSRTVPGLTGSIASLIISTVAYFIAAFFIRRQLEEMGIPAGMTRSLSVFVLALGVSYGVGYVVDLAIP